MTYDKNNIQLTSDLQQAVGFIKQAIQRSQARMPHENPPIGLVLCREMDRTVVELAIQDYTKPKGLNALIQESDE